MPIRQLPLVAGVVPFVGITLAYWLGVHYGTLPGCIPYLDGCVSISATGRYEPGNFLFRAVELPMSVVYGFTWYFCFAWLNNLTGGEHRQLSRAMLSSGLVAAVALIIYVTFLGTREPIYEFMRRFGIYFYFLGTAAAQLLAAIALLRHAVRNSLITLQRQARWLLGLCLLPFALGILNLTLKAILEDANQAENRIEWIAALCMQAWFVVLYFSWRTTGFNVTVVTRRD